MWPALCGGRGRFIQVQFYVSPIDGVKNMCGCSSRMITEECVGLYVGFWLHMVENDCSCNRAYN